ncbi:unnamed protein product, partial [marine sediment metagenome]
MYRKAMLKIIGRAVVKPWPKLFQNCRSSRETELTEEYPVQVVCAWIGNSPHVAAKHYLQVTEEHFGKAVQKAVQKAVRNPVQQVSATGGTDAHADYAEVGEAHVCGAVQKEATLCLSGEPQSVGDAG